MINPKFELVKPVSLKEVIGVELDFKKMGVEKSTIDDKKDYDECPFMFFLYVKS